MRFIDFYEKNKIIPVVDNDDIKKKIYNNQRKSFNGIMISQHISQSNKLRIKIINNAD